jgi:uncharacterized protein (DUF302 family)
MSDYGYRVEVEEGYDEAVVRARMALRVEGFSILTEMHVGGLLGPEAGAGRQYLFMGAWDPSMVEELAAGTKVSVQIPCNVVVQETGSTAIVAALDPSDSFDPNDPNAEIVATKARGALTGALRRVIEPI